MTEDPTLRTYRGRSLEEVLPQIRAELGPDAVVVRQRDGLVGGIGGFFQQQFVEVQARPGSRRIDLYDEEPALPEPFDAAPAAPVPAPAAPASFAAPTSAPIPDGPEALLPPAAHAPAPAPGPEAAAPSQARAARVPGSRPRPKLSAAELLAQATGATPGDSRTPAEILREHSASFAQQLADAETRAEPVVARTMPAPAAVESQASGRYAPPVSAPRARFAPPAPVAEESAAEAVAPAQPAVPATPPKPARRAAAKRRAAARKQAAAARAAPAKARAASAKPKPAAARAAPAKPKPAPAVEAVAPAPVAAPAASAAERPESGVGPQTTQALELAAAIAANMSAAEAARAAVERRRLEPTPRAAALTGAPAHGTALVVRASAPQPRRSLFTRRRSGATRPRHAIETPEAIEVTGILSSHGLPDATTRALIRDASAHVLPFTPGADVRAAVRQALARRIPVPDPSPLGGRAVAFVGAGGGGKTRCTAGLVAAYAQGSTIPVACLTIEPLDGGAELTALLKPHGVKVEVVATAQEAGSRVAALRGEALVVLDTPAVAPGDAAAVEHLAAALAPLALDEIQLTVPATLSAAVAQELVERLAPLQPTGIAMTHADATDHIGAVVELSCETLLPLAYVNGGTELPGSLVPADPVQLAERLLR